MHTGIITVSTKLQSCRFVSYDSSICGEGKTVTSAIVVACWSSFRHRHGEKLTVKAGESLSRARPAATDLDVLDRYYDLLETTIMENNLISINRF